ncbi:uncharacterized protein LOC115186717 isoform X2 [Salmo trutta]|uniref:uncharacterized protein LOC115186717 isoform X2 n=1 Tax=Salmo trutta TaxID=8032 RepID=UPI0011307CCF|nr:uncharacterized protein LOC115186717 isoform X2 [Salmo trutta]
MSSTSRIQTTTRKDNSEIRMLNEELKKRTNEKELTVNVEISGEGKITTMELLRGIKEVCGAILGCRMKDGNKYEITMSHVNGKERLIDGLKIKNCQIMAKELGNDELVVSFLNLPAYITDEEIEEKLKGWNVKATTPIKRRMWPGTDIVDGTRFCKVKFTDNVQSLPYSTKFNTVEGFEYFRVIHDNQVKVCRLCIQPGHILKECPEFTCHKCSEQGHYARECRNIGNVCKMSDRPKVRCSCNKGEDHLLLQTMDLTSEEGEGSVPMEREDESDMESVTPETMADKLEEPVMSYGKARGGVLVSAADKVEQQHMMGEIHTQVEMVQGASQVPEPALSLCENYTKECVGSTEVTGTVKAHFSKGFKAAPPKNPNKETDDEIDGEDLQLFVKNKRSLSKTREMMGFGKKKKKKKGNRLARR